MTRSDDASDNDETDGIEATLPGPVPAPGGAEGPEHPDEGVVVLPRSAPPDAATSPDVVGDEVEPTEGEPSVFDADPVEPEVDEADQGDEVELARRDRRRRRWRIGGVAAAVVVAILVGVSFIRLPYYRFAPGTLYPTEGLIAVDGAPTFRGDPGQIDFTTVSSKKATVFDAVLAKLDPAVEMVDASLIDGDKAPEQTRQINLEMMSDAKRDAEVVALRKLGYPVEIQGTGALVKAVGAGRPAEKVLHPNDTIVEMDGQPVSLADDAIRIIGTHKPGDTVTMAVESAPGEPRQTVTATLAARDDDPNRPLLGVDLGTRDTQFKLPFDVSIDTKDVGGPSAGLALTLGVIDVLTPGSLTGGKHVATTGTIDLNGNVGPIGGIRQKAFLAQRQGVDLFLVPEEEYEEAKRYAGDVKVVGVGSLDEALAALAENGGSTDVVEQAAAAHSTGSVKN